MPSAFVSWWLDWAALPDQQNWARLSIELTGNATVLDCDGNRHIFKSGEAARNWLCEDEYSTLESIIDDGELTGDVSPPSGATDAELIISMRSMASKSI